MAEDSAVLSARVPADLARRLDRAVARLNLEDGHHMAPEMRGMGWDRLLTVPAGHTRSTIMHAALRYCLDRLEAEWAEEDAVEALRARAAALQAEADELEARLAQAEAAEAETSAEDAA